MNARKELREQSKADKVAAGKVALLLTTKEASEALAISPRKLWSMTASGELTHLRIGRAVRYPFDDLLAYIDAQKKGGER